jgi:Flp pilus assembly protein TadD
MMNNIGVYEGSLGNDKEATEWYSRSIQTEPTAIGFLNLAKSYKKLGKLALARDVLDEALRQNPNDTDLMLLNGLVANELGKSDLAVEVLQRLIRENDSNVEALYLLGAILADDRRDYADALRLLTDAHRRFPADSSIANKLAYVYLMMGDTSAAEKVLAELPEEEFERSTYLTATRGLLRLQQSDFRSAEELYRAAERLA